MKLRQLLSWRFSLIFFHRWLGIVIGLMCVIWVFSGIILMYAGIPHFTAGERLARLSPLDLSTITITPEEAAANHAEGRPFRLRISMLNDRPVYRINTGFVFGQWTIVYADTGEIMEPMDEEAALTLLQNNYPEYSQSLRYKSYIQSPQTYSHSPALQTFMPMHKIAMGDEQNSDYYVSQNTGEIILKTDTNSRILGSLGYNLHTLFFFRQQSWWSSTLQWFSWLALTMATLGFVLGVWRFSVKPSFMKRAIEYRTPYSGWWKWHHYAGLIFGLVMLTWLFSGLVSMSEIPGINETTYTPEQINAGARSAQGQGAYVDLTPLTITGLQHAAASISESFTLKELELLYINDEPYYYAYRSPSLSEQENWISRSALDFLTPTLNQVQLVVSAIQSNAIPFTQFSEAALLSSAIKAMPNVQIVETTWLDKHDDYYYNTLSSFDLGLPRAAKTLPVLQIKFNDPNNTWLYMSATNAQMLKVEKLDRRNRWAYYGLHGFDFAFLYSRRPLWDIVVIMLLLGCGVLSTSTLVPMFRRLKRHIQRFVH